MARGILLCLVLVAVVLNSSGCVALVAGAAGGAGTAHWLSGKLAQEVDASIDESLEAVRAALKSLKLPTTKETVKYEVAQVMSKYTDDRTVWIDIHRTSSATSRIEVRVGAMSDEDAARVILDKILKYL